MVAQSALLTAFVLAGNTLLRPLVKAIDRFPLSEQASEATYEVHVITDANAAASLHDTLVEKLNAAKYPVRETKEIHRADNTVEIVATLVSLAVDPEELDAVIAELTSLPEVDHATWDVSTAD
jgi:putative Mg2+ transporter-C (MgtC) family protein